MASEKLRAFSYLRFSTPEQSWGDSHRRQSEAARRYAFRHELELDEEITFEDTGVSAFDGQNVRTGQLADFLQAVECGLVPKGSFLLVENLDRLSRQSPWDAMETLRQVLNLGIVLVTLSDERRHTVDIDLRPVWPRT